jgi:hypothetical protein
MGALRSTRGEHKRTGQPIFTLTTSLTRRSDSLLGDTCCINQRNGSGLLRLQSDRPREMAREVRVATPRHCPPISKLLSDMSKQDRFNAVGFA